MSSSNSNGYRPYGDTQERNYISSEELVEKGRALLKRKLYSEALEVFQIAVELDPGNAVAWFYQGNALSHLKRFEQAIEAYDRTLELDPTYLQPGVTKATPCLALRGMTRQ